MVSADFETLSYATAFQAKQGIKYQADRQLIRSNVGTLYFKWLVPVVVLLTVLLLFVSVLAGGSLTKLQAGGITTLKVILALLFFGNMGTSAYSMILEISEPHKKATS